jgi:hypothetical protein
MPRTSRRTPPSARALLCILLCAALWPAAGHAERSMGVSNDPDTSTRFIWTGEDLEKNANKQMMILVQKGGSTTSINIGGPTDITFAKSELEQIKWCAVAMTAQEFDKGKKCKPDKALKPGGEIKIP